ncbi:hypothetical protein JAAARDRAFT_33403 [Jaapia argillacea MUCL 33604]|uniref:AIG1-type G domain-containing protein n=1 Tax=Jaapia argillacea MUCL 33604 TaxID=933084 RepID=A0A067Q122_9AGAM|nr:hypothetical protein JAAARDRAFT_33403 [Jaapia argillacea MUCL 33604]
MSTSERGDTGSVSHTEQWNPEGVPEQLPVRNIIIFGESGCGKSSVINLLAGDHVADTSSTAAGCTFQSHKYTIASEYMVLNVFDTIGLNEGKGGAVASNVAIANLYKLVRKMDGGVNLLIYVIRGPRITESTSDNYRMFYEAFCQRNVPIVLVVTGLENEDPMDAWWDRNHYAFTNYRMEFSGHACITATPGKCDEQGHFMFEREYDESKPKVFHLILEYSLQSPWKMESTSWFVAIFKTLYNGLLPMVPLINPSSVGVSLRNALLKSPDLDPRETIHVVAEMEKETMVSVANPRQKKANPFVRVLKGLFGTSQPSPSTSTSSYGVPRSPPPQRNRLEFHDPMRPATARAPASEPAFTRPPTRVISPAPRTDSRLPGPLSSLSVMPANGRPAESKSSPSSPTAQATMVTLGASASVDQPLVYEGDVPHFPNPYDNAKLDGEHNAPDNADPTSSAVHPEPVSESGTGESKQVDVPPSIPVKDRDAEMKSLANSADVALVDSQVNAPSSAEKIDDGQLP